MENIKPFLYAMGTALLPVFALAHGNGDGHDEVVDVAHPENRMVVLAVVVIVFLVMGFLVWYARRKNTLAAPIPEKNDGATPV